MRAILVILLVLTVLFEFAANTDSIWPLADEAIAGSFVDTWDPAAMITEAVIVLMAALFFVGVLALATAKNARKLAIALIAVVLLTSAHWTLNHIILTRRAETLSGIKVGGFYGLF